MRYEIFLTWSVGKLLFTGQRPGAISHSGFIFLPPMKIRPGRQCRLTLSHSGFLYSPPMKIRPVTCRDV